MRCSIILSTAMAMLYAAPKKTKEIQTQVVFLDLK